MVSCFTGKIEMDQGIVTSLAQMLAEELDVPLKSVDMVMGDTDRCPWDAGTLGSRSTKYFGPALQAAAAEAKAVLIQLAAEHLRVPPDSLVTKAGMVVDNKDPGRKVSYGDLTKGKRIERSLGDKRPPLKPWSSYTVSGASPARTDAVAKVTGKAQYAADVSLPGILYARIVRPPAHGAKLVHIDTAAAEKVPGASIVRDGNLIAVVHTAPDEADKAFSLLKTKFITPSSDLSHEDLHDRLLSLTPEPTVVAETGDLERGKGLVSKVIESTYRQGYVAHAPIEPHCATAAFERDKVTVWASTQRPFGAQQEVAEALNLPEKNVRIITPFVGGAFGGGPHRAERAKAWHVWFTRAPVWRRWERLKWIRLRERAE